MVSLGTSTSLVNKWQLVLLLLPPGQCHRSLVDESPSYIEDGGIELQMMIESRVVRNSVSSRNKGGGDRYMESYN